MNILVIFLNLLFVPFFFYFFIRKTDSADASSVPSPSDEVDTKNPSDEEDTKNPSNEVDTKNPFNEGDTSNPLWRYVTRLEKRRHGGGNVTWRCNFCNVVKKGSYTRVRGHLLNWQSAGVKPCEKVTHEDIATMQRLENEAVGRRK